MKTRTDFVSNSSSCSFMLNQPFDACKQMHSECNDCLEHVAWSDLEDLEVTIIADKQNLESFMKAIGNSTTSMYQRFGDSCYEAAIDATSFFSMLCDIYDGSHPDVAIAFSKLKSIQFTVDDYNRNGMRLLTLLYQYFESNCNASVSTDCSENQFPSQDDDFVIRLQRLISKDSQHRD